MIKAVVFDCFGVLSTDGWLVFYDRYLSKEPELSEKGIAANKRVDAGLISYNDFVHEIAELAKISDAETRDVIEKNMPNQTLFNFIQNKIKPYYKIGLLSNASGNWLDKLFEDWQVALFDETVFSFEVEAVKPSPIMYQTISSKLGTEPADCLYIDDQPRYVDGAITEGMQGIVFTNTSDTVSKIERFLHA